MTPEPHRIGRIALHATLPDTDTALALRPRLETLAWRLMPPVLERVCDALGPADAQLRLDRLDLRLGEVRADQLEEDALAALERALGEALGEALHRARVAPSDEARLVDPTTALLRRFEIWLITGTAPGAASGAGFDPAAMLAALLAEQPATLVAMLRRRTRGASALERLVAQIGVAGLHALLATLAPADAAAILALIADIILAHRVRPVPPALQRLAEPALERLLWIATLELLLRDAGTRFNRRRFLAFLLSREAMRLGIDYAALLRLLGETVAATRDRIGFRAELPQLLTELLAEAGDPSAASDEQAPAPATDIAIALAAAGEGDFAGLLALVRKFVDDRPALMALVRRLDDALFAGLVRELEPAAADTILALLDEIEQSERVAPRPVFAADPQPVLRWLTLTYLLHDPGTQFNRRRFVAHLLESEARRAGIAYVELVRLLADASARATARAGLRASLPAVLHDLLDEIAPADRLPPPSDEEAHVLAAARAGDVAPLLALLRTDARSALWRQIDAALFARLVAALKPASAAAIAADLATLATLHETTPLLARTAPEFAALLRRVALADLLAAAGRFRRSAWLARLLRALAAAGGTGEAALRARVAAALRAAPVAGADALTAILAPELAAAGPAEDAAAALRRAATEPAALDRLAVELAPRDRHRLLAALDPVHADAVAAHLAALSRLHAVVPLMARDAAGFERLVWTLAVAWLARTAGTRFDSRALARHLLDGIARAADAPVAQVAARLRQAAQSVDGAPPPAALAEILLPPRSAHADLRQRAELFLRTGRPPDAGEDLPDIAASGMPWFAALLRRLARATPADLPALVARLRTWLLPEEILACLAPDLPAGEMPADPSQLLLGLLRGEAITSVDLPAYGARFDDLALLAHWLEHGSVPWWSAGRDAPLDLLAGLAGRSDAELAWLFSGTTREAVVERLRRAVRPLDAAARRRLLERLAPWAVRRGGPLAPLLAGRDAAGRLDILLRAAAAALDGAELDLAALEEPLPAIAPSPAPKGPKTTNGFDLARLLAWLDGGSASAGDAALFARWFADGLDRAEPGLVAHLRDRRGSALARARWVALLPPEALVRLVRLFAPRAARAWIDAALLLAAARRRTVPFGATRVDPATLWALLLDLAAAPDHDIRRGITQLVTGLVDDTPAAPLRAEAARLAQAAGDSALAAALRGPPPARAKPAETSPVDPPSAPEVEEPPPIEDGEPIFIANAGLVLFAPYLPALLERLGVLTNDEDGKSHIADIDAASRAVHLLQYMVDQRLDAPEHELVLNKLLCGVAVGQPVLASHAAEPADLELCDGLLDAVIANWPIIAGTSREGLRETFLQREGRLRHEEESWRLQVQRKGLDVLVDRVPWSFATIFHRWMPQPLQVTW